MFDETGDATHENEDEVKNDDDDHGEPMQPVMKIESLNSD